MKKPFLLLLSFIPLLASCNNSGTFPNPFPNDKYAKIGFTIDESNEKITRPLTNTETNLVLSTIENEENDKKIYKMESKKQTRDYTRAFAGEFKQGYHVKNVMKEETTKIIKQDEVAGSSMQDVERKRQLHTNISTTISQYSYGQIEEKIKQDDYIYFGVTGESLEESSDISKIKKLNQQTVKTENDEYITYSPKTIVDEESFDKEKALLNFDIKQSTYITAPDLKSGADKDGNIILVTATQSKHKGEGTEGVFKLEDGRSYQAMDNSLVVTKLVPDKAKTWCLASYVREYKEVVITSEVIQPNVQVTKLKNPITISYSEEIMHFYIDKEQIKGEIPFEE